MMKHVKALVAQCLRTSDLNPDEPIPDSHAANPDFSTPSGANTMTSPTGTGNEDCKSGGYESHNQNLPSVILSEQSQCIKRK